MHIGFPDPHLQRLYSNGDRLQSTFGAKLAALIKCRLAFLEASAHLGMLPSDAVIDFRVEPGGEGQYSVAAGADHRLYFSAAGDGFDATLLQSVRSIEVRGIDRPAR